MLIPSLKLVLSLFTPTLLHSINFKLYLLTYLFLTPLWLLCTPTDSMSSPLVRHQWRTGREWHCNLKAL